MINRYQIISLIKKDQIGGIYLAKDSILQHEVHFRNFNSDPDIEPAENWETEFTDYAKRLIALRHLNLTAVYDAAVDEDAHAIIITQHQESKPVSELIQEKSLSENEVISMAKDLLEAMDAAHSANLFHGALHTGSVQRITISSESSSKYRYLIDDLGIKHLSNIVMGEETNIEDPILIPPEIFGNKQAPNAQSDLFMIGQLCFTTLVGGHPFAELSAEECAQAFADGKQPSITKFTKDVSKPLADWITKLISPDPKLRPNSAKEAIEGLEKVVKKNAPPAIKIQPAQRAPSHSKQTTITPTTPGTPTAPATLPLPPTSSKKKTKVVIAGLLLLIISAVAIIFVKGKKSSDNNASISEKIVEAQKSGSVYSEKIANFPSPPTSSKKLTIVNPKGTLDWFVTKGPRAGSQYDKKKNVSCMLPLNTIGKFQEFDLPNNQLRINGKKTPPRRSYSALNTKHHGKAGDGWQLTFRVPQNHQGDLFATFYLTQVNCDIAFTITSHNQPTSKLLLKATTPGVFMAKFKIPNAKKGTFYTIDITSESPSSNFTLGIHGLRIETP